MIEIGWRAQKLWKKQLVFSLISHLLPCNQSSPSLQISVFAVFSIRIDWRRAQRWNIGLFFFVITVYVKETRNFNCLCMKNLLNKAEFDVLFKILYSCWHDKVKLRIVRRPLPFYWRLEHGKMIPGSNHILTFLIFFK